MNSLYYKPCLSLFHTAKILNLSRQVGWAATTDVDNFVFDQAAERYALDEEVANKLQKSNPGEMKYFVSLNVA